MNEDGLWYLEKFTDNQIHSFKVKEIIFRGETEYQKVDILNLEIFKKTLFLNQKIQSAEIDEYIYHECLVFPALFSHPDVKAALILGGGEGATLRETLKVKTIEYVDMVDIDRELVNLCKKYLPEWSDGAFDNPKAKIYYEDGKKFLENSKKKYDLIISDLSEPVQESPSLQLFTRETFKKIYDKLEEDGIFVLQSGSADPFYCKFFASIIKTLKELFPVIRPYWTFISSFRVPWGFTIASKIHDPLKLKEDELKESIEEKLIKKINFYSHTIHKSLFAIPGYLSKAVESTNIITETSPFIWEF
ncbi:MAG: spermidine synthase [Acidobacteriota bacterium]